MNTLWLRLGDNADYEDWGEDVQAVAEHIADTLNIGDDTKPYILLWLQYGLEVHPTFNHYNYISLYWGDEDANAISDLTQSERLEVAKIINT